MPGYGTHILVVDDEPQIRELLKRMLEPEGYDVLTATNAHDALRSIEHSSPAVVISDVHMPGPTGVWLTEQIRESRPNTAIILATSDATVPPQDSMRRGIVAYIVKPFNRRAVLAAVASAYRWWSEESGQPVPELTPRAVALKSAPEEPVIVQAPDRPQRAASSFSMLRRMLAALAVVGVIGSGAAIMWRRAQPADTLAQIVRAAGMVTTLDAEGRPLLQGSGFFAAPDIFVTNHHVVNGAMRVRILVGKEEFESGSFVGVDRKHDLVLLKTFPAAEVYLPLADTVPDLGESISVYGAPLGLKGTLSTGIVNAAADDSAERIQISAPISPGSSGSPVTNRHGEVVGVVLSQSAFGQALNYAVPVPYIKALLDHRTLAQPLIAAARGAADDLERHELIGPVQTVTIRSGDNVAEDARMTFDQHGHLSQLVAGSETIAYRYDDDGRVAEEIHSTADGVARERFLFAPRATNLLEGEDPTTHTVKRIEYGGDGRVEAEDVRLGNGKAAAVKWSYEGPSWPTRSDVERPATEQVDALGNPTKRMFADGREVTYTYHVDAHGNWIARDSLQRDDHGVTVRARETRDIRYWH